MVTVQMTEKNSWKALLTNSLISTQVDFLLCDPKTLKPALAIELDDSSHARPPASTPAKSAGAGCKPWDPNVGMHGYR
jgi:hypothetical protein